MTFFPDTVSSDCWIFPFWWSSTN